MAWKNLLSYLDSCKYQIWTCLDLNIPPKQYSNLKPYHVNVYLDMLQWHWYSLNYYEGLGFTFCTLYFALGWKQCLSTSINLCKIWFFFCMSFLKSSMLLLENLMLLLDNLNVNMKQYATIWQDLNLILTKNSFQIVFFFFF
jgi:hypothetical protein